jgi:hypothetical protein
MTRQLTIRGVSDQLAGRLRSIAQARGESLNATLLHVLEHAVGLEARQERLARYATWSREDLEEFEQTLRAQRRVDDELWH